MLREMLIVVSILPVFTQAEELCYGIDRKGNVERYPIKNRADCMNEANLYRSRLGPNKRLVSVNWGDISKVDAKVVSADEDAPAVKVQKGKCDLNSEKLKNSVQMVPDLIPGSGGKILGLRVVAVEHDSVWERSGIKPMDTIVSINGKGLQDNAAIAQAPDLLNVGKNALELERSGLRLNVTFDCSH